MTQAQKKLKAESFEGKRKKVCSREERSCTQEEKSQRNVKLSNPNVVVSRYHALTDWEDPMLLKTHLY